MSVIVMGDQAAGNPWYSYAKACMAATLRNYLRNNAFIEQWYYPTDDVKIQVRMINRQPQAKIYVGGGTVPTLITVEATKELYKYRGLIIPSPQKQPIDKYPDGFLRGTIPPKANYWVSSAGELLNWGGVHGANYYTIVFKEKTLLQVTGSFILTCAIYKGKLITIQTGFSDNIDAVQLVVYEKINGVYERVKKEVLSSIKNSNSTFFGFLFDAHTVYYTDSVATGSDPIGVQTIVFSEDYSSYITPIIWPTVVGAWRIITTPYTTPVITSGSDFNPTVETITVDDPTLNIHYTYQLIKTEHITLTSHYTSSNIESLSDSEYVQNVITDNNLTHIHTVVTRAYNATWTYHKVGVLDDEYFWDLLPNGDVDQLSVGVTANAHITTSFFSENTDETLIKTKVGGTFITLASYKSDVKVNKYGSRSSSYTSPPLTTAYTLNFYLGNMYDNDPSSFSLIFTGHYFNILYSKIIEDTTGGGSLIKLQLVIYEDYDAALNTLTLKVDYYGVTHTITSINYPVTEAFTILSGNVYSINRRDLGKTWGDGMSCLIPFQYAVNEKKFLCCHTMQGLRLSLLIDLTKDTLSHAFYNYRFDDAAVQTYTTMNQVYHPLTLTMDH